MERRKLSQSPKSLQSGQVAVESAIILPLFVFVILGILQLGLMHQARLLTKYAAYKAVRAGSLHHADVKEMEKAAIAVLLPLISRAAGGNSAEFIKTVGNARDFADKMAWPEVRGNMMPDAQMKFAEVIICGPTQEELGSGGQEMDFDDPANTTGGSWRDSQRTKLRIQVTLNYRMPIPFANWVIFHAARAKEAPDVLRLGKIKQAEKDAAATRKNFGSVLTPASRYDDAAARRLYITPIRATYTMRMQSSLYLTQKRMPERNQCVLPFSYSKG